ADSSCHPADSSCHPADSSYDPDSSCDPADRWGCFRALLLLLLGTALSSPGAEAQVLIRLGEPGRATYSELHEGLRQSTPAADSVSAVLQVRQPGPLWQRVRAALSDKGDWNAGLLALTRLAELRSPAYADSAARLRERVVQGKVDAPPGRDPEDLLAPLDAIDLERSRSTRGDAALLSDLLPRVPFGQYGLGQAWVLGRLRHSSDSLQARFLAAQGPELKVRYLTLLTFSGDTGAVPLLARVFAAPDSFGVPARYGSRASDALLWIGTRSSLQALLDARQRARARGTYADPSLQRGGYDFLANDSSAVISRTGKWLTAWVQELGPR
ncbi:MAG: hypothetical protein ACREMX_14015, partial [Gemmatimonadales bacterium]